MVLYQCKTGLSQLTHAAPSLRDSVTGVERNLNRSDRITTGTFHTYLSSAHTRFKAVLKNKRRVSAAQTKRTKQTQHTRHGFPFYTVFSRQQQVPRTSENSKRTLTCKAELGAILRQGARPQCMWLKNKTVKVCLAYGESTGRQSTLLYATDGNYLEKEQRKWDKALK